jgi:hypothetical protein
MRHKAIFSGLSLVLVALMFLAGCTSSNDYQSEIPTTSSAYSLQKGPIAIISHDWDSKSSVEGVVKNIGDKPIDEAEIIFKFYDSNGDFIVEDKDTLRNLEPGYNRTFWIYGLSPTKEIQSYKLSIGDYSIRPRTTPAVQSPYKYQTGPVAIISHQMSIVPKESRNDIKVTGVAKNIGSDSLKWVEIIVDFYDVSGNNIHSSFEKISDMTPNRDYEFVVDFFTKPNQISLYSDESKLVDSYILYINYTE